MTSINGAPQPPVPLTAERLRALLNYDPNTGQLVWLHDRGRNAIRGKAAGATNNLGRVVIRVDYRMYYAHRLAWLWMTGAWPEVVVDHIDGNPSNNRWSNLRAATYSQNAWNTRRIARNASGHVGVHFFKQYGCWRSCISANGKTRFLGHFKNKADAVAAYEVARAEMHGEFAPKIAA